MIQNQWYAVLASHEVKKGRTIGVKRFGIPLAFFRSDAGELACLSDVCAHRGASLAGGCVTEGGDIRCPFHGIEYAADGRCVLVPSDGRGSAEDHARFRMRSFPVREIGGIVFVWYGERKPQHEPDVFPVLTDKRFRYSHLDDHWRVHYSRVIENQLDVSHLAFVHRTTIGRGNKTLVNGPKVVWLDDNTLQTSANNEIDEGQTPQSAENSIIKSTNLTFKYPNIWLNTVMDRLMILAYFVPIDEENSILSVRFYGRLTGVGFLDSIIARIGKWMNKVIERQDKRVVETQLPKKSELRMRENLAAADLPIIEYRARRKKLQDEGVR